MSKKEAGKPNRKPARTKVDGKQKGVTPEFLATLRPEVQEFYSLARKLKNVLA